MAIENILRKCKPAKGITLVEYTEKGRVKWTMAISPLLSEKEQDRAILQAKHAKIDYEITVV